MKPDAFCYRFVVCDYNYFVFPWYQNRQTNVKDLMLACQDIKNRKYEAQGFPPTTYVLSAAHTEQISGQT